MAEPTKICIEVDGELASQAEVVLRKQGLDISSAIDLFLRQTAHEKSLPFSIDPSCISEASAALLSSIQEHAVGQGVNLNDEDIDAEIRAARLGE